MHICIKRSPATFEVLARMQLHSTDFTMFHSNRQRQKVKVLSQRCQIMTGESRALHTATDSHRGDYSSCSETVAVDMAAGNNHQLNDDELRELVSHKGTVRGIRNRVRSSLATIERDEKSVSSSNFRNSMLITGISPQISRSDVITS